jgi:hypothetical protein
METQKLNTVAASPLQKLVIIWLVCGMFNWAALLGYFTAKYPPARSNYGIAFSGVVFGPLAILPVLIHTNLAEKGFRLK